MLLLAWLYVLVFGVGATHGISMWVRDRKKANRFGNSAAGKKTLCNAMHTWCWPITGLLAQRASGRLHEADLYQKQADQFTLNDPLFHWMIGRRLQDLGMNDLAEKHLQQANQLG
jgi:hypothetical protein